MASSVEVSEPEERGTGPISEIEILWITAGLGCDGDTIAMTAATQPSIEDLLDGGLVLLQNLTGTISASFDGIVKTTGLTITLLP